MPLIKIRSIWGRFIPPIKNVDGLGLFIIGFTIIIQYQRERVTQRVSTYVLESYRRNLFWAERIVPNRYLIQ